MVDVNWTPLHDDLHFQLEDPLHTLIDRDSKLDELVFADYPSSPSSDERSDTTTILATIDISSSCDSYLNPILGVDSPLSSGVDSPESSLPSSPQMPFMASQTNKRQREDTLSPSKKGKGKKVKTDGNSKNKRERNKVSAAKYRQRRKAYIDGLEEQIKKLNDELASQNKNIVSLKTENQMLKDQVSYLKKLIDSFRNGKTPLTSAPPISRGVKLENSLGSLPIKSVGAGLFLLALCCLVFSFQTSTDIITGGSIPKITPLRGASRTLLNHLDDETHNDSLGTVISTPSPLADPQIPPDPINLSEPISSEPFVVISDSSTTPSDPVTSKSEGCLVGDQTVLVEVELKLDEPKLDTIENIATRHGHSYSQSPT